MLLVMLFKGRFTVFQELDILLSVVTVPVVNDLLMRSSLYILGFNKQYFSFRGVLGFGS